jgi:hypothetical protein
MMIFVDFCNILITFVETIFILAQMSDNNSTYSDSEN